MATFDLSAANLDLFETDHWLSDEKNCLVLRLNESATVVPHSAAPAPATPLSPRAQMQSWSASELAAFLRKKDLEGPAKQLFEQGVSGEDFAGLTDETLTKELRLTVFAAKKLLRLRTTFLTNC